MSAVLLEKLLFARSRSVSRRRRMRRKQEGKGDQSPEDANKWHNPEGFQCPKLGDGGSLEDMVAGVTWPSILPPGWTVEWDPTSAEEEHEE
uniref:Uncharacterized protein n=1 Tax=Zea mays TaxID=4577 RepID=A0A804NM22_MAIZE